MITLKNVKNLQGKIENIELDSESDLHIDCEGLLLLPALIDAHVHFRTPGAEHKENWISGSQAALCGGVTTVFDMPNNYPSCSTVEKLKEKRKLIDQQLKEANIPLHYQLFFGADQSTLDEVPAAMKNGSIAVKVYMGHSTGDLLMDDQKALEKLFKIAAEEDIVVAVHAEDEAIMASQKKKLGPVQDVCMHQHLRSRESAVAASRRAIALAKKHKTKLYLLHLSTKEELDLIRDARKEGITVYAETTPQHLFLTEQAYQNLGTYAQMNPPIREELDQIALWEGIRDGTIDSIGTDHAPHTPEEKEQEYGKAPSGIPGVETLLPLLYTAYLDGKLSLEQLLKLCRENTERIYGLESNHDFVLIDPNTSTSVENEKLKTKCRWSPFAGWELKGWPVFTILDGRVYDCKTAKRVGESQDGTAHSRMVAHEGSTL
ncbi:MAG: dihydroorotase [Waddliaceae bacterium]|nr:dihydroorotase [Waddliaceae bacterium]